MSSKKLVFQEQGHLCSVDGLRYRKKRSVLLECSNLEWILIELIMCTFIMNNSFFMFYLGTLQFSLHNACSLMASSYDDFVCILRIEWMERYVTDDVCLARLLNYRIVVSSFLWNQMNHRGHRKILQFGLCFRLQSIVRHQEMPCWCLELHLECNQVF